MQNTHTYTQYTQCTIKTYFVTNAPIHIIHRMCTSTLCTIKNKLAKCCEETGLTWVKALPIVLMYMRMRKRSRVNRSPFEILFGKPPYVGIDGGKQQLPSTELCEHDMMSYCKEKSSLLSNVSVQVKAAQGKVAETTLHDIKPGDFVVV